MLGRLVFLSQHYMSLTPYNAFISCPMHVESLLADELIALGPIDILKQQPGGVLCCADLETLYKICLWSRLANRVLLQIASTRLGNKAQLREWLSSIEWTAHLHAQQRLYVRFFGQLHDIQHTHYGAQFVKDVIVDYFRLQSGERPSVDKNNPDIRLQLNSDAGFTTLYFDLSGDSLHQRGYRRGITTAPLKENLAAALLLRAGWPGIASTGGALIDTFCGSGTFLVEAAMMAADIAPGLLRTHYGFLQWPQHDPDLWSKLITDAAQKPRKPVPPIIGYDQDRRALGLAEQHIQALQLGSASPRVYHKDIAAWKKPSHIPLGRGLLIANPPYGERQGNKTLLQHLYQTLGQQWLFHCPDWQAALFTADPELAKATRLYWNKTYTLYNGALECKLYLMELSRGSKDAHSGNPTQGQVYTGIEIEPFIKRVQKNRRKLAGWLKKETIHCYRLYDADIPEFAVAIDIYADRAYIQEYKAPASIAAEKAAQRLAAIMHVLPETLHLPAENIFLKQRARQKGKQQYLKQNQHSERFIIQEGKVMLWVDLGRYIDTGLFLDHRPMRLKLADHCKGKRFLNLFCYTAAATVHAAVSGANESVSVDMSKTYLEWAQDNFKLNHINAYRHRLIHADILQWLANHHESYDIIFLDPPTFSNSKRMEDTLDIQRDHQNLIIRTIQKLKPGGVLYFSTNLRRFKLDTELHNHYKINDISAWSIPDDFARNNRIHQCFEIKPK